MGRAILGTWANPREGKEMLFLNKIESSDGSTWSHKLTFKNAFKNSSMCRREFEGVSLRVAKLGLDAARQIKVEGLTKAARGACLGAQPSLDDCQQGLQDIG